MSAWPWMQGNDTAINDPIEPVCPEDERPSVKELIQQHRIHIDTVRKDIQSDPMYDENKHDDLWILRFVLSHKKNTKNAIAAAKTTLQFRETHRLDESDIRQFAPHKVQEGMVKEYWDNRAPGNSLIVTIPDQQRGAVCFIDLGEMIPGASEAISFACWEYAFVYTSEWTHQWLDYITRVTGRLTKSIRLVDLKGVKMSAFHRKDVKYDGIVMDKMEDCYPQLLESIKICNAPGFIHVIWAIGRKIMPKRVVEKFDIISPGHNQKERDGLLAHISEAKLPVVYGGQNTVSPHDW